jgi:hypothetical protein
VICYDLAMSYTVVITDELAEDAWREISVPTLADAIAVARDGEVALHGYPVVSAAIYWPNGDLFDPDLLE